MRSLLLVLSVSTALTAAAAPTRLKELVDPAGARDNALIGYGLVVGLPGTGDSEQALVTSAAMRTLLERLGMKLDGRELRLRNVAGVVVTAKLPTYTRAGQRLDVTVSSAGNARSLAGGVLVLTALSGADGVLYAVAQGPLQVGGMEASARGALSRQNLPTTGRIPGGATVEREVIPETAQGPLQLQLRRPDAATAVRIAEAISTALGAGAARALDRATVEVTAPAAFEKDPMGLIAKLEAVEVEQDLRARVVVSERTGTVVAGERVRLRPAMVAHANLQVTVRSTPVISQPAPFSRRGDTVVAEQTELTTREDGAVLAALPSTATVDELVQALRALGASPRDLISILQALSAAGALDGELEVL